MAAPGRCRLNSLNDLALTLKHVHWNVVGPNFIAVHTIPGALVAQRDWDDYSIGRADALAHLGALDVVYAGSSRRTGPGSAAPKNSTWSPRTC